MVKASSLPVVAIGGIDRTNALDCFLNGASGVSVISTVSRSKNPAEAAKELGQGLADARDGYVLKSPWSNEFLLIDQLIQRVSAQSCSRSRLLMPPGDDTALLKSLSRPVITTDTQREGRSFQFLLADAGRNRRKSRCHHVERSGRLLCRSGVPFYQPGASAFGFR